MPAETRPDEVPSSDELYRAHAQTVAGWASRLGGPGADVEDLVQEVFLQVHRRIGSFRGDSKPTTWLYAVTERVVLARRRKDRLRRFYHLLFGASAPAMMNTAPTPAETLERREAAQLIYGALDRLSDKYRTIFILFEIEGISGEEIAQLKGLKLATVWVRLNRARKQMSSEIRRLESKVRR